MIFDPPRRNIFQLFFIHDTNIKIIRKISPNWLWLLFKLPWYSSFYSQETLIQQALVQMEAWLLRSQFKLFFNYNFCCHCCSLVLRVIICQYSVTKRHVSRDMIPKMPSCAALHSQPQKQQFEDFHPANYHFISWTEHTTEYTRTDTSYDSCGLIHIVRAHAEQSAIVSHAEKY